MQPSFHARVEKTFRRDKKLAVSFLLFLWLVVLFVLLSTLAQLSHQTETWVLVVAAGMILLFNTASIIAMLRHYAEDRDFIYGLDIRHLDEQIEARRLARSGN
jgi:predicted membrane protein